MSKSNHRVPHRGKNRSQPSGEPGMWISVVLQAIRDATVGTANSGKADLNRQQARTWFRLSNPDFIEVCSLAGLDPEATFEKAQAAITRYDAAITKAKPVVQRPKQPADQQPSPTGG